MWWIVIIPEMCTGFKYFLWDYWVIGLLPQAVLLYGARCSFVIRAFAHDAMGLRIDPSWWFHSVISRSSQFNKCRGMCYPLCGMMYIKEPLLLIGKSSPCGGSGFHLSLSEWSFIIIMCDAI